MRSVRLIVKGKVQGVFYRQETKKKAISLGIKGYVRNLSSGDVEIVAEGDEEKLIQLIEWCRKGPEMAEVENVVELNIYAPKKFKDFSIL